MASSGVLRRVVLVRTDVSEELSVPFITVTRSVRKGTLNSSETSVLTRATRRNIPEDAIFRCYLSRLSDFETKVICKN
jgi:hypothetical protein